MDTRHLNYILTIEKLKNLTKAAEQLYVSQSSLSQYLAKLEQEVGAQLFIRAKGELILTPAGELYIEAARKVINIQTELYRGIDLLNLKGHLTIGVTSQFGFDMLTDIVPDYKQRFPGVTLEISELDLPELKKIMEAEAIDCAIASLVNPDDFLQGQVEIIRREEVFLAVPISHTYNCQFKGQSISKGELLKHFNTDKWILSRKHSTLRQVSDGLFANQTFAPNIICETNSITTTRSMVAKEIGVALIAQSCATDRDMIAYYSLEPKQYRYNVFIRRKNWVLGNFEKSFVDSILNYNYPS